MLAQHINVDEIHARYDADDERRCIRIKASKAQRIVKDPRKIKQRRG